MLLGHWEGRYGIFMDRNIWGTNQFPASPTPNDWHVFCGTNTASLSLLDGTNVAIATVGTTPNAETVVINPSSGLVTSEPSDWEVAEVLTWSRSLSVSEMTAATTWLQVCVC